MSVKLKKYSLAKCVVKQCEKDAEFIALELCRTRKARGEKEKKKNLRDTFGGASEIPERH
jgi:hypothetical protein